MDLTERKHLIHDHLIRTREATLELVGQMDSADWERPVQTAEGGWTVKQMMLHLATSESGQIKLGQAIAAGQPTVPDDFDLNRYNRRQIEKNQDKQPPEILFSIAESQQKLLAFLDTVTAEDLQKRGKHGRGDVISLEQLFYRIGEHEAEHMAEIKQAVGK
jgi:hypothetical protein